MAKREFVLLAHTFDETKDSFDKIRGWMLSQKMDGLRVFWDGGISRGESVRSIPFANWERDDRFVNRDYEATGLWTRNGKVIRAPVWFLDMLPNIPLDGELWSGYQKFEQTNSITKKIVPDEAAWKAVQFHIFDCPPLDTIFAPGILGNAGDIYSKEFTKATLDWAMSRAMETGTIPEPKYREMEFVYGWMKARGFENDHIKILEQTRLPMTNTDGAIETIINREMEKVLAANGEGLMVRKDQSCWTPERSHNLLKIKKWYDAEATVIGYVWGRKTDKGSKLLGKMGVLVCDWDGRKIEVGGFNWEERDMFIISSGMPAVRLGQMLSGLPADTTQVTNPKFPLGSKITFRYRDVTAKGEPRMAQYYRKPTILG